MTTGRAASRKHRHHDRNRRAARWLLGLSVIAALFFAVRLGLSVMYWSDPDHANQQLEPWMTVGYVARSWQVDPQDLGAVLGLSPERDRKASLGRLAKQHDMEFDAFAAEVMQVIEQQKAAAE